MSVMTEAFRISPSDKSFDTPEFRAFELAADELLKSLPNNADSAACLHFAAIRLVGQHLVACAEKLHDDPKLRSIALVKISKSVFEQGESLFKAQCLAYILETLSDGDLGGLK